jgi:hypothetical protein
VAGPIVISGNTLLRGHLLSGVLHTVQYLTMIFGWVSLETQRGLERLLRHTIEGALPDDKVWDAGVNPSVGHSPNDSRQGVRTSDPVAFTVTPANLVPQSEFLKLFSHMAEK